MPDWPVTLVGLPGIVGGAVATTDIICPKLLIVNGALTTYLASGKRTTSFVITPPPAYIYLSTVRSAYVVRELNPLGIESITYGLLLFIVIFAVSSNVYPEGIVLLISKYPATNTPDEIFPIAASSFPAKTLKAGVNPIGSPELSLVNRLGSYLLYRVFLAPYIAKSIGSANKLNAVVIPGLILILLRVLGLNLYGLVVSPISQLKPAVADGSNCIDIYPPRFTAKAYPLTPTPDITGHGDTGQNVTSIPPSVSRNTSVLKVGFGIPSTTNNPCAALT